ncbi:hypothetical protein LTR56_007543 [Elasticomyces elasticus]|nr:hypothetical protein LTR56_007543 [Elasticomyces elasticus]KAK3668135.1 hypothetical protein LTR22_000820 [Elasticomyces elasticus]KAK4906659.1 hypothetical protein LTR49_024228 [Elasticomyces elasticus]KAK5769538.1 hypothetical protein LTS12_000465 [Elasticomyces elasticus]
MGETARSVFCSVYDITFSKPVTLGTVSPYEDERWLSMMPTNLESLPEAFQFINNIRHRLAIRTPRLIAYLRALRHSGQPADNAQASIAIQLARELLSLDDGKAEGAFLRHVKLVPTDDARDAFAAPFSLEFRNLTEYREAILYWTFRLLIVTLALELATLTSGSGLDGPEIYGSQTRLMQQLFMSWQYASSGGGVQELPATISLSMSIVVDLFQGYLVIWAGLFQRMSFKGLAIPAVKAWMLPKMRNRIIGWTMDATQQTYVPSIPRSMLDVLLADDDRTLHQTY